MSKLVVLSEINCLDYLREHGVYPSMFFTDINKFLKMASFFKDVNCVCILSGYSLFSRSDFQEVVSFLSSDDAEKLGVVYDYTILTDSDLPYKEYFKFDGTLSKFEHVLDGKRKQDVSVWDRLEFTPSRDTESYLCERDLGIDIHHSQKSREYADNHEHSLEEVVTVNKF